MYDKFRWKFPGLENVETSYSQLLQDMFVLAVTDGKREGTFVEIGADSGQFINNTYLLESQFGWKGVSFDINPASEYSYKMLGRKSRFYLGDALQMNYDYILTENFSGDRVDYIQFDIEPSTNTLECLKRFPFDIFRFSCATYETDFYDPATPKEVSENVRKESRKIFKDNGYVLVAGNLSNLTDTDPMEDFYLDGQYFNKYYIEKFMRNSDEPIAAHKYMGLE